MLRENISSKIKISVIGAGYVGLSLAVLLSKKHSVIINDVDLAKIDKINKKISPIEDPEIIDAFNQPVFQLVGCNNWTAEFLEAKYFIIALPTDIDNENQSLDTSIIEDVVTKIVCQVSDAIIILKSTVPIGFSSKLQEQFPKANIMFSPEFLREGRALYDNLYPSRIIVGGASQECSIFATVLQDSAKKQDTAIHLMSHSEAEAVKLFSNTYLALRVAFFNELDSLSMNLDMNPRKIINGVSSDPRIGKFYNNPSFGYGGYCLPKDTQQLLKSFSGTSQTLIQASITSNQARKNFLLSKILLYKPKTIGVYGLAMKKESDNSRNSAIHDILAALHFKHNIKIIVYEPSNLSWEVSYYQSAQTLEQFKQESDLILANRNAQDLTDVSSKVFSRDIFGTD